MHGSKAHHPYPILELMSTAYWFVNIELSLPIVVLANAILQTEFLGELIHSPVSAVQLDRPHDRAV